MSDEIKFCVNCFYYKYNNPNHICTLYEDIKYNLVTGEKTIRYNSCEDMRSNYCRAGARIPIHKLCTTNANFFREKETEKKSHNCFDCGSKFNYTANDIKLRAYHGFGAKEIDKT